MRKHIVEGPLAAARGLVQSSSRQTRGKLGDGLRLLRELEQDLVDRERSVVHGDMLGVPPRSVCDRPEWCQDE